MNILKTIKNSKQVISFQTNDILIFASLKFADTEEKAFVNTKIMIKSREKLDLNVPIKFNDTVIA